MPRWLPIVLITSVASIATSTVFAGEKSVQEQLAQDKAFSRDKGPGPQLGGRLLRLREEESRSIPSAEYLIYQRARKRAAVRSEILEERHWSGYYPTRPTIPYTYFGTYQNPGLYKPWVVPYLRDRGTW